MFILPQLNSVIKFSQNGVPQDRNLSGVLPPEIATKVVAIFVTLIFGKIIKLLPP